MNKYIDADKLRAEIERLYDIAREASYNGEVEGEMTAYDKILSLITSLQQEQPEVDLEDFISDFFDKKDAENNGRWSEDDIMEAITKAYELGRARKE